MRPAVDLAIAHPDVGCTVTHDTRAVELLDLLVADDEWVRAEFDAIVEAGWGGAVPQCPAPHQGAHLPRRPGDKRRPTPARPPRELLIPATIPVHQRGPPSGR